MSSTINAENIKLPLQSVEIPFGILFNIKKHLKLLQNSHKIPSNQSAKSPDNGEKIKSGPSILGFSKASPHRTKEQFGTPSIALEMIEKLSTFQKSTQEQSNLPVAIPVESGEPMMIKLEPNLTTFENENHKNGASCPICGKTFSQE